MRAVAMYNVIVSKTKKERATSSMDSFCHTNLIGTEVTTTLKFTARSEHDSLIIGGDRVYSTE